MFCLEALVDTLVNIAFALSGSLSCSLRFAGSNSICLESSFGLGAYREAAAYWDHNDHHCVVHHLTAGWRNHALNQADRH